MSRLFYLKNSNQQINLLFGNAINKCYQLIWICVFRLIFSLTQSPMDARHALLPLPIARYIVHVHISAQLPFYLETQLLPINLETLTSRYAYIPRNLPDGPHHPMRTMPPLLCHQPVTSCMATSLHKNHLGT
jgi:hypothetical protein